MWNFRLVPRRLELVQETLEALSRRVETLETLGARGIDSRERRVFSQYGEDGIVSWIFSLVGTGNRTFVEFGVGDGRECLTANLALNLGWSGLMLERDEKLAASASALYEDAGISVVRALVTRRTTGDLLAGRDPEFMSIDVDGNEYWLWEAAAAAGVRPRVVAVEYNASLGPHRSLTVPYRDDFDRFEIDELGWYHGASLAALAHLARRLGYVLLGCESHGANAFFVRADVAGPVLEFVAPSVAAAYRPLHERDGTPDEQFARIAHLPFVEIPQPPAVEVLGHRMHLDRVDTLELRRLGVHEPMETDVLSRIVGEGQTVLDLGANIGYYTLLCARLVGASGRVFAFEPDPEAYALLTANVEANRYDNVVCEPAAVSDHGGRVGLHRCADNLGDHRIYDSGDGRVAIDVRAVALDDYDAVAPVDVVKMDIQGAEYDAVVGMRNLLARSPDVSMITEFWPIGLRRSGAEPREYLRLLASLGFDLYEMDEEARTIAPVDPETYDCAVVERRRPPDKDYTNLLCLRPGVPPPDLSGAR